MKRVLVLGATSSIARSIASELARRGHQLCLAARDPVELGRVCADLEVRYGASVSSAHLEAEDFSSHVSLIQECIEALGGLDGAVFAVGWLGRQPQDSSEAESARKLVNVNFTSAVSLLSPVATYLEEQKKGFILGISSVAGDRGRQSNYAYGAAKGGLSLYLQGLRNRLDRHGVKVFTLKLGFVDTAMTYGMKGLFLVASPPAVATGAVAILSKPSGVYYLPRFWRPLMWIIRLIPERIFKKLSL